MRLLAIVQHLSHDMLTFLFEQSDLYCVHISPNTTQHQGKKNVSLDIHAVWEDFSLFLWGKRKKKTNFIDFFSFLSGCKTEAYYAAQNGASLSNPALCVSPDRQKEAGLLAKEPLSQFTASYEHGICCSALKAHAVTRCIMLWLQFKFSELCMSH